MKQISCEFCLKDITRCTYIQCAECQNFCFCVNCFSKGYSKSTHLPSHRYFVIDSARFPLFVHDWSSKEEQILLEGLLKFRYGNWNIISEALGGSKSPLECELHYKQVYLHKGQEDLSKMDVLSYKDDKGFVREKASSNAKFFNNSSANTENFFQIVERTLENDALLGEFAGYMPLRKDFEIEYENDIEIYLSDLEFYDDDRSEDVAIKLKQLEVYLKVLDEREERKNFVIERWPLELKSEKKFKNNIIERNAYYSIKPFARLLPFDKHLSFCEALIKENLLKLKLEELKEARLRGIRTEEEFKKFLLQKKNNFSNKIKEYDILIREPFAYKLGEVQKAEIVRSLEENPVSETIENEFCERIGISIDQFTSLKDKIAGNMESRFSNNFDDSDEANKREFIDFTVKSKSN